MGHDDSGPGVVVWMIRALTMIIAISVMAGVVSAAVGGSLSDLGSGYGGLYGLPSVLLTAIALLVGVPAVVISRRLGPESGRLRITILTTVGVWVVAIGYSMVAHAVDPCVNGWWDARSRIGSQPLCERFGSELNWHSRFHLLAHATPAAVLLGIYIYTIKRWGQTEGIDEQQRHEVSVSQPTV